MPKELANEKIFKARVTENLQDVSYSSEGRVINGENLPEMTLDHVIKDTCPVWKKYYFREESHDN